MEDTREDGRAHPDAVALELLEPVDVSLNRCLWILRRGDDEVGIRMQSERWEVIGIEVTE